MAWFDAVTRGKHLGRAVLTRGNKAKLSDLPAKLRTDPLRFAAPSFGTIPEVFPNRMVNLATAKAFSAMWFRKAPKHRVGRGAEHHHSSSTRWTSWPSGTGSTVRTASCSTSSSCPSTSPRRSGGAWR